MNKVLGDNKELSTSIWERPKFMLLNLPNPPGRNIERGYAGGYGVVESASTDTLLPIYLLYGASAAKTSGCKYDSLDAQAIRYDSFQVVNAVRRNEPDVLISWASLPSIYDDLRVLNEIKKAKPNTLIIVLGTVCNVMPEEVLLKGDIDLVVEGAYPHYNLISNLIDTFKRNPLSRDTFDKIGGARFLKAGKIVQSSIEPCPEDLNQLSLDVYHQLPLNKYLINLPDVKWSFLKCIPIITSIGCPYSCIYCPYPVGYGNKVRTKSILRIINEIEFLKNNFGISGFLFRDQNFTHSKKRVLHLCDEIISRDLNINWCVEARVDQVSKELLSKMKEAGCFRIHYGVESGSPEMLRKIGKPGVEIDVVRKAFRLSRELGIATTAHMILGLPGENHTTLKDSVDLLYDINPDNAHLSICTPYPGTKLFEIANSNGWISVYDWSKYTSYDAVMNMGELRAAQLSKIRKKMENKIRNFKLLNDLNYRKAYFKRLPRAIRNCLASFSDRIAQKRQSAVRGDRKDRY